MRWREMECDGLPFVANLPEQQQRGAAGPFTHKERWKKKENKEGEKKKKGEVWRDDGALKPAL